MQCVRGGTSLSLSAPSWSTIHYPPHQLADGKSVLIFAPSVWSFYCQGKNWPVKVLPYQLASKPTSLRASQSYADSRSYLDKTKKLNKSSLTFPLSVRKFSEYIVCCLASETLLLIQSWTYCTRVSEKSVPSNDNRDRLIQSLNISTRHGTCFMSPLSIYVFPYHGFNKLVLHRLYVQVVPELETDISGIASRHKNK